MPFRSPPENAILEKIHRSFRVAPRGRNARASRNSLPLGMGDDAALFSPSPGCQTILTCDWFLQGTHFLRDKHSADAVGWKSLARAVSDIAAMGGTPRCFLLSLALPQDATSAWLDAFLVGLRRAAKRFACPLAGGDTTKRREILINITVIGEVASGRALRRDAANPGDFIYVSGRLGAAQQGLQRLRKRRGRPRQPAPAKASLSGTAPRVGRLAQHETPGHRRHGSLRRPVHRPPAPLLRQRRRRHHRRHKLAHRSSRNRQPQPSHESRAKRRRRLRTPLHRPAKQSKKNTRKLRRHPHDENRKNHEI